ncbi:zinc ABC transporter substrate-binding protein ZnuA [Photorhabdus bodei]|uniref:High-affinity zinc uptake system protein ZnuA n=1 Tax=Photorhabdus bodei TaxID=2029681 RepID=A0A329WYK8_9GAMM|nr:zinc ABC transporter substrate-binding protein ZnuA [Photorhabdus bodei]NDK99157.1 zinc ABC transporter substrate-binding protein ZnuA [Photorhabdus bodei]NDL03500.1 zinc ABC transporter substrate-binding protein ZnuA [Photorhabdus bodei]NDL07614.1 zinc ABC transporter substrate-binding protein ZnuA [Photorhabdus bodei]RAX09749.1 zinc ABC transporter substrate-binding protein [Photorhabdus bodei]
MLHKSYKLAHKFLCKTAITAVFMSGTIQSVNADVVTSIRPLGFIAAAITEGVTDTQVLLPDGASPHDYALKPSDLKKVNQADLVVWVGPEMEIFLSKPLAKVPQNKQLVLAQLPTIRPLLLKNNEDLPKSDQHKHEDGHEHHSHGEYNMHIWLSPEIAKQVAQGIYDQLQARYPHKKAALDVNLRKFNTQLAQTDKNIANILKLVRGKGYFVFHDAYGYFEQHYGLTPLGHFTINPEIQPGAQKLHHIRTQLVEQKATCIFAEPQFRPTVINAVAKGTGVRMGTLDPLGGRVVLDKDSYMKFITQLSEQYAGCLN